LQKKKKSFKQDLKNVAGIGYHVQGLGFNP
jgi:hypothetical protein